MNQLLFTFLNDLAGQHVLTDRLIIFAAEYLGWLIAIGLIVVLLTNSNRELIRRRLAIIAASGILAYLVAEIIKRVVNWSRPELVDQARQLLHYTDPSFPSGHTATFAAIGVAVYAYNKRWGNWLIILAVIIGLARVVAGIHWPVDILAGLIIGWAVGKVMTNAFRLPFTSFGL